VNGEPAGHRPGIKIKSREWPKSGDDLLVDDQGLDEDIDDEE